MREITKKGRIETSFKMSILLAALPESGYKLSVHIIRWQGIVVAPKMYPFVAAFSD